MPFTKIGDVINSRDGSVIVTIDGKNKTLAQVEELTYQVEAQVQKVNTIGRPMTGHKVTSVEGSGTLKMYLVDSTLGKLLVDYSSSGKYPSISITATIEDPTSGTGKQVVLLSGVIFATAVLGAIANGDSSMEASTNFTFDAVKILTPFS